MARVLCWNYLFACRYRNHRYISTSTHPSLSFIHHIRNWWRWIYSILVIWMADPEISHENQNAKRIESFEDFSPGNFSNSLIWLFLEQKWRCWKWPIWAAIELFAWSSGSVTVLQSFSWSFPDHVLDNHITAFTI